MGSSLYLILLLSGLWALAMCVNRQFHVMEIKMNWTDAQNYCRGIYTDLATIDNQDDTNTIQALIGNIENYWIGLRQVVDKNNKTRWIWSDGSNSTYTDWGPNEPNNGVGDICVQLYKPHSYRWNDAACFSYKYPSPFICYKEIPLILVKQEMTWKDALKYCTKNHVDLVSVLTNETQQWVETVTKNVSTPNVWLGLRHTCTLGFWYWVIGESICYQNWAPGNGTGVEDCRNVERTGAVQAGRKQWVSLPETQKLNFICTI